VKKKLLIFAIVGVALAGAAVYYRYVPGHTPAGQPALAYLDTAGFEQQFRAAAGETRLVALLSPT
jgi:hypothetical protein